MKYLDILRGKIAEIQEERKAALALMEAATEAAANEARAALTDAEQASFDEARDKVDAIDKALAELAEREAELAALDERTRSVKPSPQFIPPAPERDTVVDVRSLGRMSRVERRDTAMRILEDEDRSGFVGLAPQHKDAIDKLLRKRPASGFDPDHVATRMIATENPAYQSAFAKAVGAGLSGRQAAFTVEEAAALNAFDATRAMAGSVDTAGGYGVPVLIDPTMIFTSQGHPAVVVRHCDIKTITTDTWKGVSTAGMTFSFDDEGAEVSDDTMTLAQPSIPVWTTRGFQPFSVEVEMDYPGLVGELSEAMRWGYEDDLALYTATGTGSSQPTGWQVKLDATSASEVTPTTDGTFAGQDVSKVWTALPERFRPNAVWFMHSNVGEAIAAFATSTNLAWYTVDLTGQIEALRKRPVEYSDYFQSFVSGSTGALNILSVGDPRGYSVVRRLGMTVEAVPLLFGTSNAGRPKLQRGILAYARWGADFTNTNAARLLQNQ